MVEERNQVGVVIDEAIDVCVHVGEMVSPVVCNSSPEGFMLPGTTATSDYTDGGGNSDGRSLVSEEVWCS